MLLRPGAGVIGSITNQSRCLRRAINVAIVIQSVGHPSKYRYFRFQTTVTAFGWIMRDSQDQGQSVGSD